MNNEHQLFLVFLQEWLEGCTQLGLSTQVPTYGLSSKAPSPAWRPLQYGGLSSMAAWGYGPSYVVSPSPRMGLLREQGGHDLTSPGLALEVTESPCHILLVAEEPSFKERRLGLYIFAGRCCEGHLWKTQSA